MEKKDIFELTNPQRNIWSTEQYFSGTNINNVCGRANITEKVNFAVLKDAIQVVLKTNSSFLINFELIKNEPFQYVAPYHFFDIKIIDVQTEEDVKNIEKSLYSKVYKIEDKYLYDTVIYRFPNGTGGFFLNTHHLLGDSWSLGLYCKKVIQAYSWLLENNKKAEDVDIDTIPGMASDYTDYCKAEKEYLNSAKFEKDKQYWNEKFETIPEVASLPSKSKKDTKLACKGARKSFEFSAEISKKINDFCKSNNISNFNFITAIYSLYISRCCNLDDFVIGTPVLNRSNFAEKNTQGMFVSTAPLRINLKDATTFTELAKNIAKDSMGMLRHQKYPYEYILKDLRAKEPNLPNLYNILISYQITKTTIEGLKHETSWAFNGNCADELQIHIFDLNDFETLNISYDYKTDKFEEQEIVDLHKRIEYIINQVLKNNEVELNTLEIVTPTEKEEILNTFNNTAVDYPKDKTIVDLFEEQVEKTPNNVAVVFEGNSLTYKELNEKANQLANYLRGKNIKNNDIIGVCTSRSFEMIISILAVLKAGAAYIPIDPEYPNDRISYMLENSKAKLVIANNTAFEELSTNTLIVNFKNPQLNITDSKETISQDKLKICNLEKISMPDDLSYIIYTSGSTGRPKGVMLTQSNFTNLYYGVCKNVDYLNDNKPHSIVSITTISFDIFAFESIVSLTKGLKLFVTNEIEQKITPKLENLIKENKIEIIQTTPSTMNFHLNSLSDKNSLKSLKYVILAGEQLPKSLVDRIKKLIPGVTIFNGYGPSETTIFSTITNVTNEDIITIGKPIVNTQIYILDKTLNLLPKNCIGELYIAGDGVGKGYLFNDELTSSSFIPNPFNKNSIMYKVGDLGVYRDDGKIECKGRIDFQVKLRGLRIELEEIEEAIKVFDKTNSTECAVIVIKNSIRSKEKLVAFINSKNIKNSDELKQELIKKLPNYMIPNKFVFLDSLPHTPNGKIDRKTLNKYNLKENDNIKNSKANTQTERELVDIISSISNTSNISIEDDFYVIGLDSFDIIRLSTEIVKKYKIEIPISILYSLSNIKKTAEYIEKNTILKGTIKIEKAADAEFYPLSSAQKRIYYTTKIIGENNLVYNTPGAILVNKILDKEKVEKAFNTIIQKQSSFRTSFVIENNEVMQKINENLKLKIMAFENKETEMETIISSFPKPFNLEKAPLLRVEIHYIENAKTLILLDSHHIVMDGQSLSILISNFCKLYNDKEIASNTIDYKDYSVWENKYSKTDDFKKSENYWLDKFQDAEFENLNLPYDYSIPNTRKYEGNTISYKLNKENFEKYINYAKSIGLSPYMFFISAFFVLLYKYTGQEDIKLGTPTIGRNNSQLENIIGMFVNNFVVNAKIDSSVKFEDFAKGIKEQVMQDLTHQDYPYDMLVKKLQLSSDSNQNPMFDVMFIYQNTQMPKSSIEGSKAQIIKCLPKISKFNLSMEIEPNERKINIEYRTDLFKQETIKRLYEHYINTLNEIVNNQNIDIKDICIISNNEKDLILNKFNNTKVDYPDKTVIELFEEQVEKNPDKIAVVFEGNSLTYSELNKKANQLAYIIKEEQLKPESVICILLDKSIEMIISILAILKNRCAYLPIDTSYPRERIDYIIKNSNSKLLLTSREIEMTDSLIKTIYVDIDSDNIYNNKDSNLNLNGKNTDLAYVMYTSGSTGNPKGVMIENKSIVRLIKNTNYIKLKKSDRILQTGSIVFDACTFEIWGAFFNSLPLYIIKKETLLDAALFHDYILKNKITVMWLTSPLFNQLCEENPHMFRTVRCLLTGGDVLSPKHINMVKIANPNLTVINGYGPTENTTFSCCYKITKKYEDSIPIGKPIANSTCYIVSKDNNLQPIGIPGELLVGGDGVARGYLNNKLLTKEKFIYSNILNENIYKTGDLVKWNKDGTIQFLGRIDTQIKIRGFRVELSEISTIINTYPKIKESYCIFDNINNTKSICAYIVSNNKIKIQELKDYLNKKLPKYMIPKYFMQIKSLPINQNGKVNKHLLPKKFNTNASQEEIILPTNKTQKKVYEMYKNILGVSNFSITDNFFNIGGDSITAMKLQIEGLKNNYNITYGDIFKYPSVKNLANFIDNSAEAFSSEIKGSTNYRQILYKNTKKNITKETIKRIPIGNVLLTGVTGFLGSHILDSYLKNEKGKIYCLIRTKNNIKPLERLKNTLHFYFDKRYDSLINDRIICVEGDITQENLGISKNKYEILGNEITTVIHSAALVKHFGNYDEFKKINVDGTKNLIDFCKLFNIKLMHISTISVSGNNFAEGSYIENNFTEDINYCEKNFYIGQNLENLYVRSKFLAEQAIFDEIKNGLKAYVLRMGNLTSRYSEGKFQKNHYENAFVGRIKSLLQIGAIPDYMLSGYAEFTPIDYCADAIIKIANHYNETFSVFHVFNEKHVQLPDLCDMVNELGISLKVVSSDEFNSIIDNLLQDNEKSGILSGIVRDFNSERKLIYESNIKIKSDFTKVFLKEIGFEWPVIDIDYLGKYLKYLIDIGYLNLKTKEN